MLLKIFVVMGVTYFFEFVGFILSWLYGSEKVWKYLVFNNIVNALQGVLIFVVLICKRPIWKMLSSKAADVKSVLLSKRVFVRPGFSNNEVSPPNSIRTTTESNHPTDVVMLYGISGKYSTSSMVSTSTTTTEISNI